MASKLRRGMEVIVLAGREKGKKGKILRIDRDTNRVLVEGVNIIKKAMRPTQTNQTGGFIEREAAMHISNVAALDPKTGKGVRVGFEMQKDVKVRVGRGSNASGEAIIVEEKA